MWCRRLFCFRDSGNRAKHAPSFVADYPAHAPQYLHKRHGYKCLARLNACSGSSIQDLRIICAQLFLHFCYTSHLPRRSAPPPVPVPRPFSVVRSQPTLHITLLPPFVQVLEYFEVVNTARPDSSRPAMYQSYSSRMQRELFSPLQVWAQSMSIKGSG